MSTRRPRAWRRWLPLTAGLLVLTGAVLWQASGIVAARLLERELRAAGWAEARVVAGAFALPEVRFDRVELAADASLVAEDVRARLGPGVERISIERLRIDAEITADGTWRLPTSASEPGGRTAPLDLLPPDGLTVARAEILVRTPLGVIASTLADLVAQPSADVRGGALIRVRIDDGEADVRGVRVAGLGGQATAELAPGLVPSIDLAARADEVSAVGVALGSASLTVGWHDRTARFSIRAPTAALAEITIDGEAVLGAAARTASITGSIRLTDASPVQGRVELDAELESPAFAPLGSGLRGRFVLSGDGLAYPGLFTAGTLALSADLEGSTDELQVTLREARAELVPAPRLVPAAAKRLQGEALSFRLEETDAGPPTLGWSRGQHVVELAGRLAASAADARVATTLHARLLEAGQVDVNAPAARNFSLEADLAGLVARNLPWDELVLGAEGFDGALEYGGGAWRLEGAGTLTGRGAVGAVRLDGLAADFTGTLAAAPDRVVLTAFDCIGMRADALEIGAARIVSPAPLCVRGGADGVLLTRDRAGGRTAFTLALDEQPLRARLVRGEAEYALDGRWPSLVAAGEAQAAGTRLSVRASGGAVASPDAPLAASGLDGSAELRDGALVSAAMSVARIESRARPAPIVPFGVELTAERRDGALSFDAIASDELGAFVLEAVGRHAHGQTEARVRLYPVTFVTGATEIGDLSPLLAEHVAAASGVLELDGDVEWMRGELKGSGTLRARDFGATIAGIEIAGVSTEMRFASLLPPATATAQTVTVERIDLGMPLERGRAVLDLGADGALDVRRLEFALAGGRLFAEPFTVDSGSLRDIGFVLRAEDVELSHFLAFSGIEGLAGTGVLSGRVPVRLIDGGIRLDEGTLAAETDGVLRYTPSSLPDFLRGEDVRSQMLREVLTNFRYEELSLAVSGESGEGGEQTLTLNARGANPDFLDGHPIELSFNFRGPLLGAVRSAVDLTGAAELERLFEQRETENEENSR